MTTKTEALKLALEALENAQANVGNWWPDEIAVIREALAEQPAIKFTDKMSIDVPDQPLFQKQPAQQYNATSDSQLMEMPKIGCVNHDCDKCKAQQQEPVAKPYAYEYGKDNGDGTYSVVIEKGDLVQTAPAVYNYVRPRNAHKDWPIKELFDAPPASKPWVGLTGDEILNAPDNLIALTAYVEAKLREKNNG